MGRALHCTHKGDYLHTGATVGIVPIVEPPKVLQRSNPLDVWWSLTLPPGIFTFWGSATRPWIGGEGPTQALPKGKPTCAPFFLANSVNFLTVHPSTIRSPQSTPYLRGLNIPVMFPLTATSTSSSKRSADVPMRTSYPF